MPDMRTSIDDQVPIGFPCLPTAGSEKYFELIHHWLKLCDKDPGHNKCQPDHGLYGSRGTAQGLKLPKRVIDVGSDGDDIIYLRETKADEEGQWIALSHQWGAKGVHERFCTTTANRPKPIREIDFSTLPATFRDAVKVTRALKHRYLWIDSLCIVQEGADSDFNEQAKTMEQVYSDAYCVIASSRKPGHYAGFLDTRNERPTITLWQTEASEPFYISEDIDNFEDHVLKGSLQQRGWVLQEHALARRTVYFTDHQTYFECGDGVRCETMAKMNK